MASSNGWLKVGAIVRVEGVNLDYCGEIVELLPGRVVMLKNASWIADAGRLGEFVKNGRTPELESEFVGDHCMHWLGISRWPHKLFTESI